MTSQPEALFTQFDFGAPQKAELDQTGHLMLPEILTSGARHELTTALEHIARLAPTAQEGHEPNRFAAEFDPYLEGLIGHPELLRLARLVLGDEIRFDHCVALNRPAGNRGIHWHSHGYGDTDPRLGFVRIFFYINGFEADDGGLKVVPGSHLFRDPEIHAESDEELRANWLQQRHHPHTNKPLAIEALSAPPGSVVLMWTHAAHAVTPRRPASPTRWCVVYAYRNPGEPSRARWISEAFERKPIAGAKGLLTLY